jgi:hypothetical protein
MRPDCAAQTASRPWLSALVARLQAAVDHRYDLPVRAPTDHALHQRADRLAAANKAYHVVGWSCAAMREQLRIALDPLEYDPLDLPPAAATPARSSRQRHSTRLTKRSRCRRHMWKYAKWVR